jgi:hypothetical protein
MLQWDDHLGTVGTALPHILANGGFPAGEPVLRHQAVVDPPCGVPLLWWPPFILFQPAVDDR